MNPQLQAVREEFERITPVVEDIVNATPAAALLARPGEGRWSVGENIAHLTLTTTQFLPIIDSALAQAPAANEVPLRMDLRGRILLWFVEPPYRKGFSTTKPFEPANVDRDRIAPEFIDAQAELLARIERADGLAIDKVNITSPFDARVRYNLYSCFRVLAAHQRRHLWQAQNVRRELARATTMAA